MFAHVAVVTLLSALASHASADCCTIDDPIGPFRTCSPLAVAADKPFLVKAINYTRYHDDLGGGRFDPDERWDSIAVWLARSTNRECPSSTTTGCVTSGPVCKLIDCLPLSQDASRATNGGGSLITDFVTSVPAGAGPDGAYYDLASSMFDRYNSRIDLTTSVWRQIPYANNESSLQYDNNWNGFNVTGTQKQEGTNGDGFYPFEVASSDSWPGFDLHRVPCRAYACARKCVEAASTGPKLDVATARACIDKCEGVDDITNYCPDVGGKLLGIVPKDLGFDSQPALDRYVPDGCAKSEEAAFPEAYASYSASASSSRAAASASSAAAYSASTAAAAKATAKSGTLRSRQEVTDAGTSLVVMSVVIYHTVAMMSGL